MIVESPPIKFREDDAVDMRMLDLLLEMYRGKEQPFFVWTADGYKHLRIPPTIVKIFDAKPIADQAPSVHGVPSNG